jgi:hypothetical protein
MGRSGLPAQRLCKENQVSLYVVIMSTNGYYYDWTGMTKVHA